MCLLDAVAKRRPSLKISCPRILANSGATLVEERLCLKPQRRLTITFPL